MEKLWPISKGKICNKCHKKPQRVKRKVLARRPGLSACSVFKFPGWMLWSQVNAAYWCIEAFLISLEEGQVYFSFWVFQCKGQGYFENFYIFKVFSYVWQNYLNLTLKWSKNILHRWMIYLEKKNIYIKDLVILNSLI